MSQLQEYVRKASVDEIYCCVPYLDPQEVRTIIELGEQHQKRVKIITDYRSFYAKGVTLERYGSIPILNITPDPIEDAKAIAIKRLFDFSFALGCFGAGTRRYF